MFKEMLITALSLALLSASFVAPPPAEQPQAQDLMAGLVENKIDSSEGLDPDKTAALTDFSIRLFQESQGQEGKNTLISPVSIIYALGMTANGTAGESLAEMEGVFGLTREDLNHYAHAYSQALGQDEGFTAQVANSIWLKDSPNFTPNPDFLQVNKDFYQASIYLAPFDASTAVEINRWVEHHTQGMIPTIIDQIPDEALLYLINATALDAKWARPYQEEEIFEGTFSREDGSSETVSFMYKKEGSYLEGERETGFCKDYQGNRYRFVALLPKEGISMADYVQGLTGDGLQSLLAEAESSPVLTALPKFQTEYKLNLNESLESMGLRSVFSPDLADLTPIGTTPEPLFVNRILHKTFLAVDEVGTQAGAVTSLEIATTSMPSDPKTVYLTRPFLYLIVDKEQKLPLFIGTVMEVDPQA